MSKITDANIDLTDNYLRKMRGALPGLTGKGGWDVVLECGHTDWYSTWPPDSMYCLACVRQGRKTTTSSPAKIGESDLDRIRREWGRCHELLERAVKTMEQALKLPE